MPPVKRYMQHACNTLVKSLLETEYYLLAHMSACRTALKVRNWICHIPERAPFLQLQSTEDMLQKQIQQRSLDSDKNTMVVAHCVACHNVSVQ